MTARRRFSASSPLRKAAAKPDVRWIPLGAVTGAHGLRCTLRVKQFNADSELLFELKEIALRLQGELQFHRLSSVREASKGLLLDLDAVRSVDAAEALRGAELCLPRELLPELPEGEFYFVDLEGLSVFTEDGTQVGVVERVQEYPASEVLRVQSEAGVYEVPMREPYLVDVDICLPRAPRDATTQRMRYQVVTLFPELVEAAINVGLLGKAVAAGVVQVTCISPRRFTTDKHQSVDDTPYGGGSGMMLSVEPIAKALDALDAESPGHRILLTPAAARFDQAAARRLSALPSLTLVCGRYEGFDERVRGLVDEELSLGDFVLNGGEIAALAIIEATARLLPNVIGNSRSLDEESHADGLLEYPQYTRPRSFRGQEVPAVLLSGDHGRIARWRRREALAKTRRMRPDLFAQLSLDARDRALLDEHDAEAEDKP
jgi:tRNA (guanine37-N1)-methyltransferase